MHRIFRILIIGCLLLVFFEQCRFRLINQPSTALPGDLITVTIDVEIQLPETNPHKGILCILLPIDWSVESATYSSPIGSGMLSQSAAWADSVEACYPAADFAPDMQWVAMISDTGYTYQDPFEVRTTLEIQTGYTEGCYNLAYLATKATEDLICSGESAWAPLSYPHPISLSSSGQLCDTITVEQATEWDDLFYRSSGWTGADGIYTIPLSGDERETVNPNERTLILFSDTFIGEVDENDARQNASLINNTYAILDGKQPLAEQIDFYWSTGQDSEPQAVFVPNTPQANPDDWYWLMDGITIADSIHVFGLRLQSTGQNIFGFEIVGIALLSFVLSEDDSIETYRQVDTPVYYRNESEGWEIVFGQAIMPMHAVSGNPDADGYIYIYGPKNTTGQKELVVARVLPEHFSDFSQWRYWDGSQWQTDIASCASITNGISQEFSVSPLGDQRYILVFQTASSVGIRIGDSPTGPFGVMQLVYDCPEVLQDPDIFVYNAKAHPHLSYANELLISYNVNTFEFADHFSDAGIYRPRFITLEMPDNADRIAEKAEVLPQTMALSQNFPNPFNPTTAIGYRLSAVSQVELIIYNVLGQRIATLVNEKQAAGDHQVSWDASGFPSGIYYYRIIAGDFQQTRKMILIK